MPDLNNIMTGIVGWLLPKCEGAYQQPDKYLLAYYLVELTVKKDSPLIGSTWEKADPKDVKDINLIKIIRGKKATWWGRYSRAWGRYRMINPSEAD